MAEEQSPDAPLPPAESRRDLPARAAQFLVHHPRAIHTATGVLVLVCLLLVAFSAHFSSDVLDLFPEKFDSVNVWKTSNRVFAQGRSLIFAFLDEKQECDLEDFAQYFATELRKEPWAVRIMNELPLDDDRALSEAQTLFVPMLLNLPPEEFAGVVTSLQPAAIHEYVDRAFDRLRAGSMKDEKFLQFDPLGVLGPALKQLGASNMESTFSLTSPDNTLRLIQVVTNQTDLGAHASQEMMRKVEVFRQRVLAGYPGVKPEVLVTGRTAFVGELSVKMRTDIIGTLFLSAALVSLVFWIGFRRVRPLLAIMHVLLICCVVAVAVGALMFSELNMITIGLCSILIGLGVDFGMMLYAIYEVARDQGQSFEEAVATSLRAQGRSVIFAALTSAAAFICHCLSGCPGFVQLGALIACGILFAGFFMMTIFFVTIGRQHRPRGSDPLRAAGDRFTHWIFRHYHAVWVGFGALLLALSLFAFSPFGTLRFDADPKTLQPPGSNAGRALDVISEKMPGFGEQLLVLLQKENTQGTHDDWTTLQQRWGKLVQEKKLKSVSVLAGALSLSPANVERNAASLAAVDFAGSTKAFADTLAAKDGQPLFPRGEALLKTLSEISAGQRTALDWRQRLPPNSSWWFLLDQFFSTDPNITAGFVIPLKVTSSLEEKESLRLLLAEGTGGVPYHLSGWKYTLQDLVPWAKGMLVELSVVIVIFNIVLLAFLYRRLFPLFVLMLSLALCIGALIASLKLFGIALNLFNVLAFPLVIGVGVDYGIYVVIAMRAGGNVERSVATIVKPVLLSGLTATAGFASLAFAENPALRGLGLVSALGIAWCLLATFFFILPIYVWRRGT